MNGEQFLTSACGPNCVFFLRLSPPLNFVYALTSHPSLGFPESNFAIKTGQLTRLSERGRGRVRDRRFPGSLASGRQGAGAWPGFRVMRACGPADAELGPAPRGGLGVGAYFLECWGPF